MIRFLELLTELIGWVQIVLSPLLIGLAIGAIVALSVGGSPGIVIGIVILAAGLVTGIIIASKAWRNDGTIAFVSSQRRISVFEELNKQKKISFQERNVTKDRNYAKLAETGSLQLGHIFEAVYLTDKVIRKSMFLAETTGDPTCGLIGERNDWCLAGGTELYLWTPEAILEIEGEELRHVYDMRHDTFGRVLILTDPWSKKPAIWEFNPVDRSKRKIRDFFEYVGKEYRDEKVEW
ncbi:MAG: hypothetical protein K0S33_4290 [Bacteroidetes bacterium]|jgi:hypothetical protein|nr:hypothetical protein [Bacteroidota bacterium]